MSRISSTFKRQFDTIPLPKRLQAGYTSFGPSTILKKDNSPSSSRNVLRKSTGSLAAAFAGKNTNKSKSEFSNIESEYIKNLQQQIYFLELEANYLRDQAKKATDMHPKMTAEAEHMLRKLRDMQCHMDEMQTEVRHSETNTTIVKDEKEQLLGSQRQDRDAWQREKRLLTDELIQMKREKDRQQRELNNKDTQLLDAKSGVDKSATAIKNAELQISTLKCQLDQRIEQHKLTQLNLDEKRSELLTIETQLRELEGKYYSSTVSIQDKVTHDLREELRYLRQSLKETELAAENDRYLRDKISEDSSHLVKENALLNQQTSEMQRQIERERGLRESNESRNTQNIAELVCSRDVENQLQLEIEQLKEQLKRDNEKGRHYLEELTKKETSQSVTTKDLNSAQNRVSELESVRVATDSDNAQLRKDKMLLVDHVADLQTKLEDRDRQILYIEHDLRDAESRVKDHESEQNMEHTMQSQKWEEFGRLAESMRTLSHSMASQAPRTKTLRY